MVTVLPPKPPKRSRSGSAAQTAEVEVQALTQASRPRPRRRKRSSKRLWALLLPLAAVGTLVAIAPPLHQDRQPAATAPAAQKPKTRGDAAGAFRYAPDAEAFSLDVDPRAVQFDLLEGWDREQDAFADRRALAFVSGPMYERYGQEGTASTVPLGDLKLGARIWRGPNRSAARQRAFLGIRSDGKVVFGFGELTAERAKFYDTFIGGLHSVYNDLEPIPAAYKGAYSISMGQQIRYYLPRIRVVYGLRSDGRLAILMSRDGLTLEQTRAMARKRGFVAAYMPDHASKSRFIIPGVKGFSSADANWISGGATSFVHVPYMLRLSRRSRPLPGVLLENLPTPLPLNRCSNPLQCGVTLAYDLADRALAGLNRLMEQGVEPLARLIWAPQLQQPSPGRSPLRSPLREPVITADPQPVQDRQRQDLAIRQAEPAAEPPAPLLAEPSAAPASENGPAVPKAEGQAALIAPGDHAHPKQDGAALGASPEEQTHGSRPPSLPGLEKALPGATNEPAAIEQRNPAPEPQPPARVTQAPAPLRAAPPIPPAAAASAAALPVPPPPPATAPPAPF